MCGIVAALAYGNVDDKVKDKIRQEAMIFSMTELLQLTQNRGKEATGIVTMFDDCDYLGLKMGVCAVDFIMRFGGTKEDYEGYLKVWRKKYNARMSLGHCRKPSTGGGASADDNVNNHPIKVGDILGVHNGTLLNDDEIFKNLGCKRDGNVDSEAIFRLLNHYTNDGQEPFSLDGLSEVCRRIDGTYSVLAISGSNPFQMAGFRDGRPLEALLIRPLQILVLASEKEFLKSILLRLEKMSHLYQIGKLKFPVIEEEMCEVASLPDDHAYIFDTRAEITSDTKIEELFISKKVERTNKIWKKEKTYTTGARTYTNASWNAARKTEAAKEEEKKDLAVTSGGQKDSIRTGTCETNTKDKARIGMAWNKEQASFDDVVLEEASKKHPTIELDCETGQIKELSTDKVIRPGEKKSSLADSGVIRKDSQKQIGLELMDKPIDTLIADPAKIKELKVVSGQKDTNVICLPYEDRTLPPKMEFTVAEVDISTDPDVLEKAINAERAELSFSNDYELANILDVENSDNIKKLPPYSLANRIKSKLFPLWFYAGYILGAKEAKTTESEYSVHDISKNLLERAKVRNASSREIIRNIKTMIDVVIDLTDSEVEEHKIGEAIEKAVSNGSELKKDVLTKVFKTGDMSNRPIIKKIVALIS